MLNRIVLQDDEVRVYRTLDRVTVRLAQLLSGTPYDKLPPDQDVITAGLLWRTVLWPIVEGESTWRMPSPLPEFILTEKSARLLNAKAPEARSAARSPRKAVRKGRPRKGAKDKKI